MKLNRLSTWMGIAALALLPSVGCRVRQEGVGSKQKGLDTLAGKQEKSELRACEGTLDANQGIKNLTSDFHEKIIVQGASAANQEKLRSVVVDVLNKTVPAPLVSTFLSNNGSIIVSPKTSEWCVTKDPRNSPNLSDVQIAFAKANQDKVLSCWSKGAQEFSSAYNIVLQYDADEYKTGADPVKTELIIRSQLVRTFGYVTGQLLTKIDYNEATETIVDSRKNIDFDAFKMELADKFVLDLRASMQSSEELKDSSDGRALWAEILKADAKDPVAAWDAIKKDSGKSEVKKAFEDFVFAESFDSHYCSPKTRSIMQENGMFAKTGIAYSEVSKVLDGLDQKLQTTDGKVTGKDAAVEVAAGGTQLRGFFRSIFSGLFRAVGAVFHGVVRVVGAVVRAVANVVVRTAQFIAHAAAYVVRFVANVGWVVVRAAANVVRGVHNWIWTGSAYSGYYFRPVYNPEGFNLAEQADTKAKKVQISAIPRSQDGNADWDLDGVMNSIDQCSNTGELDESWKRLSERPGQADLEAKEKAGEAVKYLITAGAYAGCARGQSVDYWHFRNVSDYVGSYYKTEGDHDGDGIEESLDRCSNTPKHSRVHAMNTTNSAAKSYVGCAKGQSIDR
jgi:hypothetical protein